MGLISVIIPTYNRTEQLSRAIRSVLEQTYRDFELIIIDDGSTDRTYASVSAVRDSRLRYFFQPNAGVSAARNKGIEVARGDYISFLDDDDLFLPEKLEKEISLLETNPDIDLITSGAIVKYSDADMVKFRPWERYPEIGVPGCLYACPILTCTVLIRRNALNDMEYLFDTNLPNSEDGDFFIRLILSGAKMAWLPEELSMYQVHPYPEDKYLEVYKTKKFILDKILSQIDEDGENINKDDVYLHFYLGHACRGYAQGLIKFAHQNIFRAMIIDDRWINEGKLFVEALFAYAKDPLYVINQEEYLRFVQENLPTTLQHLSKRIEEKILFIQDQKQEVMKVQHEGCMSQ